MTNETIPELPDWVKVLINDARSEGYNSGVEAGTEATWKRVQDLASKRGRGYAW